jgi:autotransporter-associated beta strand protein
LQVSAQLSHAAFLFWAQGYSLLLMRLKFPIQVPPCLVLAAVALLLAWASPVSHAATSTWLSSSLGNDWNNSADWLSNTIPNGPGQIATFGISNNTFLAVTANTEVDSIIFNSGASSYTITSASNVTLEIDGAGIINNSGTTQTFVATGLNVNAPGILFNGSATAGNATLIANGAAASGDNSGIVTFTGSSTAGTSTITNLGTSIYSNSSYNGGITFFLGNSNAGNAHVTLNPGTGSSGLGGGLAFENSASAASGVFTILGSSLGDTFGGQMDFYDGSTAGNATFTVGGGTVTGALGSYIEFFDSSTAGTATFIIAAGVGGANGEDSGTVYFDGTSSASHGTFVNAGATVSGGFGGDTIFLGNSTAGNATLTASGGIGSSGNGLILFSGSSQGGAASIEVFGNGALDISYETSGLGVSIGSLQGTGMAFLGGNQLTVGSDNSSATFSGAILDGGTNGGTGGSLVKTGTGRLILSGSCGYTGGTTINGGELRTDSIFSSNIDIANGGLLSGTGIVLALTLEDGGNLSPGDNSSGEMKASSLTWNGGGVMNFTLGPGAAFLGLKFGSSLTKGTPGVYAFNFANGGIQAGQTYTIIGYTGTNFSLSDFTYTDGFGLVGTFSLDNGSYLGGRDEELVDFTVTAVPEQSAAPVVVPALGILCLAGCSLRKRVRLG